MAGDALAVFGLLLVSMGLFISDRVRPDIVAWLIILALMVSGLLPVNEALVGFTRSPSFAGLTRDQTDRGNRWGQTATTPTRVLTWVFGIGRLAHRSPRIE